MIGVLAAVYPFFQFIGAPILGRLSDKYGRKPVLVISQIGTLVGFLMLGFANSLLMLILSRMVDGISGANIATAQAAIADSTSERNRTQGLGLIGAAFGLGFIAGPLITFVSLTISDNNYAVPAFVAAVCSLASILLTAFWFKETLPPEERGQNEGKRPSLSLGAMVQALRHPAVGLLLFLIFAQQLAFGGFEQFLALFTLSRLGLNGSGNAIVFVFVGIIIVAVQGGFIGPWSRRFGDRKLVYGGLGLISIGLLAVAFTPYQPVPWYSQNAITAELSSQNETETAEVTAVSDIPIELPNESDKSWFGLLWVLATMVPIAIGGGILQPSINSLITKRVAAKEVGGILGISTAFLSAANIIAPLWGGAFFQTYGATTLFFIWGIMMGICLIIALRYLKPGNEETIQPGLARGGQAH
jgi:DHA1 family tetracycline resistance protein-like MFS transporter